jgi:hypothetical protein
MGTRELRTGEGEKGQEQEQGRLSGVSSLDWLR